MWALFLLSALVFAVVTLIVIWIAYRLYLNIVKEEHKTKLELKKMDMDELKENEKENK
ncbi:MAG: hypothetical protein ACLRVD_08940 [Blautia caecimuris]|jgi:hypothetical protein